MKSVKKEYKEYLNTRRGADNYNRFKNVLYEQKDTVVESVLNYLPNYSNSEEFSILDVGGGDGKRVKNIIGSLHKDYSNSFSLDFVEQSSVFVEDAKQILDEISNYTSLKLINREFEKFSLPKQYDIVLALHSIFAFETKHSLEKLLNAVSPNGILIVVSNSTNSLLGTLKNEIDNIYDDERFEIYQVKQKLRHIEIPFETDQFETSFKINSELFNASIETILRWLTLDHWKEFNKKERATIKSIFDHFSRKINEEKIIFSEMEEILTVQGKVINQILNPRKIAINKKNISSVLRLE